MIDYTRPAVCGWSARPGLRWLMLVFVWLSSAVVGALSGTRKDKTHSGPRCESLAHKNRTVLVDAGANCGNSLKRLQQMFPRLRDPRTEVYLWEANPHVQRAYLGDIEQRHPRSKLFRNAVWIRDEQVTFYLHKRDENKTVEQLRKEFPCKPWDRHGNAHGGSSMLSESIDPNAGLFKLGSNEHNRGIGVQIEGRDFASWLASLRLCKEPARDYVIVKIDIEGIEYPVLSRIVDLGLECIADKWLVEFHHQKRQQHPATTGVIARFVDAMSRCPKKVALNQKW